MALLDPQIQSIHNRISEIQSILTDFRTTEESIKVSRKSLYQEWAQHIEKLMELGELKVFKHEICSIISKSLRTRGASDAEVVYLCQSLPLEYKDSLELSSTRSVSEHSKRLVEESRAISNETFSNTKQLLETVVKHPDHFSPEQHSTLYYLIEKIKDTQERNCDNRHINLFSSDDADNNGEGINSWSGQASQYDEELHVEPSSEPGPSLTYYKVKDAGEKLIKYSENIYKFKPPTAEHDRRWSEAWDAFIKLLDPATDLKWKRSWRQWRQIMNNRIEHSLHGSMSMSKEETKVKGVFRSVTREQIDAKMIVGFKLFGKLTRLPGLIEMFEHVETCMVPDVNDLSVRMHEKLSNAS